MALSQCLDDSPLPRLFQRDSDARVPDWYNERHRLALEELVSGGPDSFHAFLKKERIPNFLSDDEVHRITSSAAVPRCASACGEDAALEHSLGVSVDCSSVTYFPDVSDVEPPVLEMGWPAFTTGSFRGITRAVAHFQPGYGGESESIYSCKEAARRMIRSAKEVIAVVTDSLTDLDIFRDLQEACTRRRVPVYLLLDQSCVPSFLQMCRNASVRLEELRLMCVRTITGPTYFLRSGAKIVGEVHERFMLIDGNRVATGSYRFNWTDGKLNSSNLMELSGQISEKFDEEFRILYAQSLPLPQPKAPPTKCQAPPGAKSNGIYDRLLLRPPVPEPARLDCFRKLTKERQYHYSTIRSKLDHMVALLAQRRELGDLTNLPLGLGARRVMCRAQGRGTDPAPAIVDSVPMGPWSRTRKHKCIKGGGVGLGEGGERKRFHVSPRLEDEDKEEEEKMFKKKVVPSGGHLSPTLSVHDGHWTAPVPLDKRSLGDRKPCHQGAAAILCAYWRVAARGVRNVPAQF
ncbi:protein FAM83D-like, partial [Scleropages formosus]